MLFTTCLWAVFLTHFTQAGEDITTYCCDTKDGCCGPEWDLHCCNFVSKICCYRDQRIHALRHHNHRHWGWDHHWVQVVIYFMMFTLIITGLLLCCKGRRRQADYKILSGSSHPAYPTAPVQQNFPADEYPLIDYQTGQPQGHSLNSNQRAPPPPYFHTA
ncbi:hypothetical protein L9F63_013013 [Diploptera punctata]|uniref:Vesicular, overexpressed in cancer, prosurvival protein 1 n=1 Tax=Diploptera punctata TaxID=6984 RepID=A0AAD8EMY0_DIPPU|nr:hypothetical protein L9F63_013013 [Diploptera punctata]